jgi:hypothetical protein
MYSMKQQSQAYETCVEIMKTIVQAGFTYQITRKNLKKVIMLERGGDPRTFRNWLNNLVLIEFLKPVNATVFRMNLERCPEALALGVKEGQKKLM